MLFVLPTCLLLAVLVPLGEVPDEVFHVLRADSLLQGEMIGHRQEISQNGKSVEGAGVDSDPALIPVCTSFPGAHSLAGKKLTPSAVKRLELLPWANTAAFCFAPTSAIYMPVFYVPAAIAIGSAHALHFSPYHAVLGARIANALSFVFLGVCALLLAKRGRLLLFCVLALPMTISLAASVNQDGLLIATSVLAFALLTRASEPRGFAYWLAAILIAVVVVVKVPYVPLVLLLLIPCGCGRRCKKTLLTGARAAALAAIPGIVWAGIVMHWVATPYPLMPPYHPGNLWPGKQTAVFDSPDVKAQSEVFLHRPFYPILLPMRTIETYWAPFRDEMIGSFGWLEFGLPRSLYIFWEISIGCAILSAAIRDRASPSQVSIAGVGIGAVTVFLALCAVFDAEYLSWSRVGAPLVDGIQGRYLLPLLAACAVFIPAVRIGGASQIKAALAVPAFAAAACGMLVLPALIVSTYYLR